MKGWHIMAALIIALVAVWFWPAVAPPLVKDLTPQQRIDAAFKCLELHQKGFRCE